MVLKYDNVAPNAYYIPQKLFDTLHHHVYEQGKKKKTLSTRFLLLSVSLLVRYTLFMCPDGHLSPGHIGKI